MILIICHEINFATDEPKIRNTHKHPTRHTSVSNLKRSTENTLSPRRSTTHTQTPHEAHHRFKFETVHGEHTHPTTVHDAEFEMLHTCTTVDEKEPILRRSTSTHPTRHSTVSNLKQSTRNTPTPRGSPPFQIWNGRRGRHLSHDGPRAHIPRDTPPFQT